MAMPGRFERLRAFLERVAFAGLKPDVRRAPKKSKLESLLKSAEEIVSRDLQPEEKNLPGPMTLGHKLTVVAGLLLVAISIYVLIGFLRRPAEQREGNRPPPPPVQIVPPGLKVDVNKDLEVVEMEFNKASDPKVITGTLRNRTDRAFARCQVSFHVTTQDGAQLGAVETTLQNVAPHASVRFRIFVPQKDAGFTMVRELRAE
jgi:hypothetical protein